MKKTKQSLASPRKKASTPALSRRSRRATDDEIDERVIAQAEDDAAWEPLVQVSRKQAAIGLPGSLAQRAAFLARLHRERSLQTWVERVIRERVELEERAFTQARRELGVETRRLTRR
jgi:predicted HicB family RNase H-like nuclease